MNKDSRNDSARGLICRLREVRVSAGLTQVRLAALAGLKRQAVYDVEKGKYMPNTLVALKLSRALGVPVEELFGLDDGGEEGHQQMLAQGLETGTRVTLFKVRSKTVCHSADSLDILSRQFAPADGMVGADDRIVIFDRTSHSSRRAGTRSDGPWPGADDRALLAGCDPAFGILSSLVALIPGSGSLSCRFASSGESLGMIASGLSHMAGVHYHGPSGSDNLTRAKASLQGVPATVFGFAHFEEGIVVAPGNPLRIRGVADLTGSMVSFVNRECGAAIRVLFDRLMDEAGIEFSSIRGYDKIAPGHFEAAAEVAAGRADAAPGLRAVARALCLGFVPLAQVRCDIIVPNAVLNHPGVVKTLDVLQSGRLRQQVAALAGYETRDTGEATAMS